MEQFTKDVATFLNEYRNQVSSYKNKQSSLSRNASSPKNSMAVSQVENILDNFQKNSLKKINMHERNRSQSNEMMSTAKDKSPSKFFLS
jgi:hypothetical protein